MGGRREPVGPLPTTPWREALEAAGLPKAGPQLMVALDIDGTIIHHDTTLSPRVAQAIRAHLDAGTHIMVATGRSIGAADIVMEPLGMDRGFAVLSNGSVVTAVGDDAGALGGLDVSGLEPVPAQYRLASTPMHFWRTHTFDASKEMRLISQNVPGAIIALETVGGPIRLTEEFPDGELAGVTQVTSIEDLLANPITSRLTVRVPQMSAGELLDRVEKLGISGVEYAVGWSAWMDITPAGVSKASGLEDVRKALGIPRAHTLTMGDSGNDCEMLEWGGLGVAMGNSSDYVRSHANTVGESVDDDGVALVLEQLL
ncbi:hydroxymethylpyrimidine pyrophosphatase-like HAD family hydrolase [Arcanobacterium wilhelmae]|uniref:Hydroxymethylpyrimidine pyrophosphatase-like HAD family hydrolase n=1 Tax=Arcanobacterium wilhelmae TaxID=1803177 RepID=A0ABT9NAT4_9ACTO|nr:HAD family hydrolase [Arcanobacterium wilhelmae]MDP9800792.1 hydroxymethylpyrimidine pyrophosphatase-like HAD family hydrolase [Arcanobacterium wilhelmae]